MILNSEGLGPINLIHAKAATRAVRGAATPASRSTSGPTRLPWPEVDRGHSGAAFALGRYGHLFEGTQAKLSEPLDALRQKTANNSGRGAVLNIGASRFDTGRTA